MSKNPLVSPDFEDRLSSDGTYLQDCCNIEICPARDIRNHGCLLGSNAPRCPLEEKKLRIKIYGTQNPALSKTLPEHH